MTDAFSDVMGAGRGAAQPYSDEQEVLRRALVQADGVCTQAELKRYLPPGFPVFTALRRGMASELVGNFSRPGGRSNVWYLRSREAELAEPGFMPVRLTPDGFRTATDFQ